MKLEIIIHCWRFSRTLIYELSSLFTHAPDGVTATIFYDPDDRPTVDVLDFFGSKIDIGEWPLPKEKLLRRAIGRNMAARASTADIVWFCDADYYFGPGCLEVLTHLPIEDDMIYYPRTQQINKTHALGDQYARAATKPGIYSVAQNDFRPEKIRKAIGGLQIVTGDTARKHGYCDGCKVQGEVSSKGGWAMTLGDQVYRGQSGIGCGNGTQIHLPNLYRIRQSTQGVVDTLPVEDQPAQTDFGGFASD